MTHRHDTTAGEILATKGDPWLRPQAPTCDQICTGCPKLDTRDCYRHNKKEPNNG
jgi:hypothetical protein